MKYALFSLLFFCQGALFGQKESEAYKQSWKLTEISGAGKARFESDCKPFISPGGKGGCINQEEKSIYHNCCWTKTEDGTFTFSFENSESFQVLEWNDHKIVLESLTAPKAKLVFVK